jgi:hypothetical protein
VWATAALVAVGTALVAVGSGGATGLVLGGAAAVVLAWSIRAAVQGRDRPAFRGIVALLLLLAVGVVVNGAALS